jgi:hypothetical protein
MPFELESMTKVKVLDVRVLAAKDRKPDDPPGAQLLLQATLASDVLAMFDGFLPSMLFRKAEGSKQGKIEGLEGSELTSIGDHVKRLRWDYEQTGCTIEIDHGTGGKRNVILQDCKVHRVSIAPREGGSVVVQWTVDATALSDGTWAKLPGMKATDIQMTMLGPEPSAQGDLHEEREKAAPAAKQAKAGKGLTATDAFVDQHAPTH